MLPPEGPPFTHHTSVEAGQLMDELCDAYSDAYGTVPGAGTREKSNAFRSRATKGLRGANYSLVTARLDGELIGFVFGYGVRPEVRWWDGLRPEPPEGFTVETGSRTVLLAEIEVRRAWQGHGIGRTLHDAFLCRRSEERATLASNPAATTTHALYERWGWHKIGTVSGKPGSYYREYVLFMLPLPLPGVER
ncbi:MAG: GNAT family N-acetyltransferase [Pseudonocardiaceae bacterium]